MAARTNHHKKLAEEMRSARAMASARVMSRAEFLAQTPADLRVARVASCQGDKISPSPNGKR